MTWTTLYLGAYAYCIMQVGHPIGTRSFATLKLYVTFRIRIRLGLYQVRDFRSEPYKETRPGRSRIHADKPAT
jgi:hypothetical protein